ncbi:hypothetical protein F2P56_028455, partial [Juglans regia]
MGYRALDECCSLLHTSSILGWNLILRSFSSYVGHLTAKSDVYSYGVVLLEMLSGKRAIDKNRPNREHNLVNWAKPYLSSKRKVIEVLDARIEGQYPLAAALKAANLANQCLSLDPKFRPSMNAVVRILEQLQDSEDIGRSQNE